MNLSQILSSSLKFLNVADKTIPLIKEINPTVDSIKSKLNNLKGIKIPKIIEKPKEEKMPNRGSLTFFK